MGLRRISGTSVLALIRSQLMQCCKSYKVIIKVATQIVIVNNKM